MKKHVWLLAALLILTASLFAKQPKDILRQGEPYYPCSQTECLVKFQNDVSYSEQLRIISAVNGRSVYQSDLLKFHRVELNGTTPLDAVKYLRAQEAVQWANFNYIAKAMYTPNDTFYEYQWHFDRLQMESAWDITRGSSSVIVAVADCGFQFDHEDWTSVQTVSPYDFVGNDNNPQVVLDDAHAMHVAGTIVAATNNNLGVAGIAPLCRLMPVRVLDDSGSGYLDWIADGIAWAATHDADVLNLSLGFEVAGIPQDPGPPLSTAISTAANAGVVICAASGNDGQPYVAYPAAYSQCIAVGATAMYDAIAPYSNQGSAIDLVAPGGNTSQDLNSDGYTDGVLSTVRSVASGDYYVFWQGTSMAAPHVSGVAALLLSNGLDADDVRDALQETATDLGSPGWDTVFGAGRINAHAALLWSSGGGSEIPILSDGLNSWPPAGWTLSSSGASGEGWTALAGNSNAGDGTDTHSGSNAAFHDDEDTDGLQQDWLVTPEITIPQNATSASISFWQRNYYLPDWYEYHGVWYSTSWPTFYEVAELSDREEEWTQHTLNISDLIGETAYFAFLYEGDYATEWYIDDAMITATVQTSAGEELIALPLTLNLAAPYPNPFNSTVTIPFSISHAVDIELSVFNVLGQRIETLIPERRFDSGTHVIQWSADGAASGEYFVRLSQPGQSQVRKIVLLK